MPIKLSFNGTDTLLISNFKTRKQRVLEAIAERMTLSMQLLQDKAKENLEKSAKSKYPENPDNPSTGDLAASIANPRVDVIGTSIIGRLDWGGDLPYARIQEEGGNLPVIHPIGKANVDRKIPIGKGLGGRRKHTKGAVREFGADVIRFMGSDGEFAFSKVAFPNPIPAKHFMHDALQESIEEIKSGIQEVLSIE